MKKITTRKDANVTSLQTKRSKTNITNYMNTIDNPDNSNKSHEKTILPQEKNNEFSKGFTYLKTKLPKIDKEKIMYKKIRNISLMESIPIQILPNLSNNKPDDNLNLSNTIILPKLSSKIGPARNSETLPMNKGHKLTVNTKSVCQDDKRSNKSSLSPSKEHIKNDNNKYWNKNTSTIISAVPSHDKSPIFQKLFYHQSKYKEEHKFDLMDFHTLGRRPERPHRKIGSIIEDMVADKGDSQNIWDRIPIILTNENEKLNSNH